MSGENTIDFWFSMGSTYTYLTVMRLPTVEQSAGVRFRWRPFYLGRIFTEMNNVPFADKPAKQAYMWRDIERRASMYDIRLSVPAPYPVKQVVLANRIAYLGIQSGWGGLSFALPTVNGSSTVNCPGRNQTFLPACEKQGKIPSAYSLLQTIR